MQKWYNAVNRKQQIFIILISIVSIPVFIGLILTPIAIYLELGRGKENNNS